MKNNPLNQLHPAILIPPGNILGEELAARGMTQREFARRTSRPEQAINEIIHGKKSITHDTAIEFEKVLGIPASIWVNLESNYRLALARVREQQNLQNATDQLHEFPIKEMASRGWIGKAGTGAGKADELLRFFGVASFDAWRLHQEAVGFRIAEGSKVSEGALSAWVRRGEIQAASIETAPYDAKKFRAALGSIRGISRSDAKTFVKTMVELCGDAGVAVVFVKELPKSGANGLSRWLSRDKALIQMSLRLKWADVFWFSFFHEAAHILNHSQKQVFIEFAKAGIDSEQERVANEFARDFLIPKSRWFPFIDDNDFSKSSIKRFSKLVEIDTGIIVGRLQKEKYLPWRTNLTSLKKQYAWVDDD